MSKKTMTKLYEAMKKKVQQQAHLLKKKEADNYLEIRLCAIEERLDNLEKGKK